MIFVYPVFYALHLSLNHPVYRLLSSIIFLNIFVLKEPYVII